MLSIQALNSSYLISLSMKLLKMHAKNITNNVMVPKEKRSI